jgi:hypothetical protein
MAIGSKKSYSSKQKRQAEHIAEGYKKRGTSSKTAKARALGDGEQIHRWRQEKRKRPRQEDEQIADAQGRAKRRPERQETLRSVVDLSLGRLSAAPLYLCPRETKICTGARRTNV